MEESQAGGKSAGPFCASSPTPCGSDDLRSEPEDSKCQRILMATRAGATVIELRPTLRAEILGPARTGLEEIRSPAASWIEWYR